MIQADPATVIRQPVSAPVSADLATERDRLVAAARAYAEASLSDSTRRAYQADLKDFALWCHDHGVSSPPASAETIWLYVADLGQRGRVVPTIQRRLRRSSWRTAARAQIPLPPTM
jgi:hypothetical protein